jgi:type VI secretion system protein ImpC
VEEFDFVENVDGKDHSKYLWSNSAYALGAVVTRAHKLYGWCACIRGVESGGKVEDLPVHTFPTDDGDIDMKCPTEVAIGDRRGGELDKLGFIPMFHYKNTPDAVFMGTQSANEPKKFEDANSTANANLTARLNYLFPVCRFAHYLKVIVRNKIGSFKERADMEKWLNTWIMQYVTSDPDASDETKAKYPLREASVEVQEVEGNPGFYTAQFRLRPHFQLEGVNISMRLVSKLPAAKG